MPATPSSIALSSLLVTGVIFAGQVTIAVAQSPTATPATAVAAPSQPAAAAREPAATDPEALLLQAARLNGLVGGDVKPWHLKASFTVYRQVGKPTDQGTYEELWVNPSRFKIVITSSKSSLTEYGTEDGVFVSGNLTELSYESARVEELLSHPVDAESADSSIADQETEKYGTTEFRCLYTDTPAEAITLEVKAALVPAISESRSPGKSHPSLNSGRGYCLGPQIPVVRLLKLGGQTVIRNNLFAFQGRYVAGDIERREFNNFLSLRAHVEVLENLPAAAETDFHVPADAVLSRPKFQIRAGSAKDQALKMPTPVYPPIAILARVTGVVAIDAGVDKAGRVMNTRAENGPAMLCQAALDAVNRWTFKPYIIDGEPVAFGARINIRFSLK